MKTIKFRIEPNSQQREVIDHMIDANRLVYNNMLTACRTQYEREGAIPTVFDLNKLATIMRYNSPYVSSAHSMSLQETSKRVHEAFARTSDGNRKRMSEFNIETFTFRIQGNHYPRYKSFNQYSSFTYPSPTVFSIVTERKGRKKRRLLKLGKIPGTIRCYNQSTPIDGMIKTCTIKRKDMGRYHQYFACVTYEETPEQFKESVKGPVGVDIGIHNIAALSDGTTFPNDHIFMTLKKTLDKHQRRLSRTSLGTTAYRKLIAKINHVYEKIRNHRKNMVENISSYLIKNHSHIVMEDLSIKELRSISKNRFMTNGYNDASLGLLRRRIADKASSAGREMILVDPKDTSQMCSVCEEIVKKSLNTREHNCPYCGYTADRDVNAARNILDRSGLIHTLWVDQPPSSLGQRTE